MEPRRSIPAWAGKPARVCSPCCWRRVYPRVGGETSRGAAARPRSEGLSPRGRGNLERGYRKETDRRSIPAWAGKPRSSGMAGRGPEVYPRVGGETTATAAPGCGSPGLSPRGRGNHPVVRAGLGEHGSIPAWAGKPRKAGAAPAPARVYPRVGGETELGVLAPVLSTGLSPRGRGNPQSRAGRAAEPRSIPAWAGKPGKIRPPSPRSAVYPRVGGETSQPSASLRGRDGLSPRGRGNRASTDGWGSFRRSIPAWAGKPRGPGKAVGR